MKNRVLNTGVQWALDTVPDIFSLVVTHGLAYAITEAGGGKWFIRVLVHFDRSTEKQRAAISQIERLLDIFDDYRNANYEKISNNLYLLQFWLCPYRIYSRELPSTIK